MRLVRGTARRCPSLVTRGLCTTPAPAPPSDDAPAHLPNAEIMLRRDFATLVEDVHFSGLDGASKLAQLADDLCIATLNPAKRRAVEGRLRRFVAQPSPDVASWLKLQRWLYKQLVEDIALPPEIFRVIDLCATGQSWDRTDPTIATTLSAMRKSWAENHHALLECTAEFSRNWTDPRYREYADRALQIHDIITYSLTISERKNLYRRLCNFNNMVKPTREVAKTRLMHSLSTLGGKAASYNERGERYSFDLAPLLTWLINGHDHIVEAPPGWEAVGAEPVSVDPTSRLAALQPIPIISALLLQVRETVVALIDSDAEGAERYLREGDESFRVDARLEAERGAAGTLPLIDLDAMAPSARAAGGEEKGNAKHRTKTASVYLDDLTLRGFVAVTEIAAEGDAAVAVELERALLAEIDRIPAPATKKVYSFLTGGVVAQYIRSSTASLEGRAAEEELEKERQRLEAESNLLDSLASSNAANRGPFPVYINELADGVSPRAIFNAFDQSVGGVVYVETRHSAVTKLATPTSRTAVSEGALGLEEEKFEVRGGENTILSDVSDIADEGGVGERAMKWREWKAEQQAQNAELEESAVPSDDGLSNPFLDGEGVESIEAFLLESDNSAGDLHEVVEQAEGAQEEEQDGVWDDPLAALDDTITVKGRRKLGVVEYLRQQKKRTKEAYGYAVVCFDSEAARARALCEPLRYFGVAIANRGGGAGSGKTKTASKLYRTQSADAPRRLWIGNLSARRVTDLELVAALNKRMQNRCAVNFGLLDADIDELAVVAAATTEDGGVAGESSSSSSSVEKKPRGRYLSRNHAYIQFDNPLLAELARKQLHGTMVHGQRIRVNWARTKR